MKKKVKFHNTAIIMSPKLKIFILHRTKQSFNDFEHYLMEYFKFRKVFNF